MSTRIYKVDVDVIGALRAIDAPIPRQESYLVDASSPHQARAYVAGKFVTCAIAKPREIVDLLQSGVLVETAVEGK